MFLMLLESIVSSPFHYGYWLFVSFSLILSIFLKNQLRILILLKIAIG